MEAIVNKRRNKSSSSSKEKSSKKRRKEKKSAEIAAAAAAAAAAEEEATLNTMLAAQPSGSNSASDADNENIPLNTMVMPTEFSLGPHVVHLGHQSNGADAVAAVHQQEMLNSADIGLSLLKKMSGTGQGPVNEWMPHMKVKELEQQGVKIRRGRFSAVEEELLTQVVRVWLEERNLDLNGLLPYLNRKLGTGVDVQRRKEFWRYIASHFPDRTMSSLYLRLNRRFHPSNQESGWTQQELDHLRVLVGQFGTNWQEIGRMLGRFPENCRTRWRSVKHVYERQESEQQQQQATEDQLVVVEGMDTATQPDAISSAATTPSRTSTTSRRRMTREEQLELLRIMFDRFPRTVDTGLQETIHIHDLRLAMGSAPLATGQSWAAMRELMQQKFPDFQKNSDYLRLHWTLVIVPQLRMALETMAEEDDDPVLTYRDLLALVHRPKNKKFTVAAALAMLNRVKQLYPDAFLAKDIVWTEVHKCPEFLDRNYRSLQKVFIQLMRTLVPMESPLYVHVAGVDHVGAFPAITELVDFLIAVLSLKDPNEPITLSNRQSKQQQSQQQTQEEEPEVEH